MQIQNSKFHKVWEIEDKGNFSKIRLGDSKKDKDVISCDKLRVGANSL